jgi:hypothetical protein
MPARNRRTTNEMQRAVMHLGWWRHWHIPRLKARSSSFAILLKRARLRCVFAATQLLVPGLFLRGEGGVEGGGLSAVEVQGRRLEERGVAGDEDVFDG